MERRGEERDKRMPNSTSFNRRKITKESPLKLPLAPIVSNAPDRRGNAKFSSRRGSAIFSPSPTLPHNLHLLPPPQHHQQLQKLSSADPDPDPDPGTPTISVASKSEPSAPPPLVSTTHGSSSAAKYRECLKNHAASMGGYGLDGCGEFMPRGEEGTAEALRCAACDCHRNFHRKDVDSGPKQPHRTPPSVPPPKHHQPSLSYSADLSSGHPTLPTTANFSESGGWVASDSSGEDPNMFQSGGGGSHAVIQPSISGSKKRFRTKFSQEQKDRMQELAEKLGWRIQKQDERQVEKLCHDSGVKRQAFRVWMHNSKQAKKRSKVS